MAGRREMPTKPSRSDEIMDPNEQIQITEQVRARFDSMTPKRHQKPTRSDPDDDSKTPSDISVPGTAIPELEKFRSLKCQPVFHAGEGIRSDEEFVVTTYYEGLISIDKQHHTTGTGFIRVGEEIGENGGLEYGLHRNVENGMARRKLGFTGNPAMNDWVPAAENVDRGSCHLSFKPIRSG